MTVKLKDISTLTKSVLKGLCNGQLPTTTRAGKTPTKGDIYDFANETGNGCYAVDFLDMNARTNWTDGNGRKIMNWKGAFLNYCKYARSKERINGGVR